MIYREENIRERKRKERELRSWETEKLDAVVYILARNIYNSFAGPRGPFHFEPCPRPSS